VSNSGSSQKCIQHKSQKNRFRRPKLLPQAPTTSKSPFPSCTSQLSPGRFARHRYITRLSHLTRSVPPTVSTKSKLTSPQNPAGPTLTVLETCLPYQFSPLDQLPSKPLSTSYQTTNFLPRRPTTLKYSTRYCTRGCISISRAGDFPRYLPAKAWKFTGYQA
jgi:hypothetical protein